MISPPKIKIPSKIKADIYFFMNLHGTRTRRNLGASGICTLLYEGAKPPLNSHGQGALTPLAKFGRCSCIQKTCHP